LLSLGSIFFSNSARVKADFCRKQVSRQGTDGHFGVRHTGSERSSGTARSGPEIRENTEADLSGTGVVTRISVRTKADL
jgi:hypothetical protein